MDVVVDVVVENVDEWSFDVFQINETGEGHVLKYVGYELLQKYNLINKFKVRIVRSFPSKRRDVTYCLSHAQCRKVRNKFSHHTAYIMLIAVYIQAMWEEFAGQVVHRDQLMIC